MRTLFVLGSVLATGALSPPALAAQAAPHVVIETTSLVVDQSRMSRLGVDGVVVTGAGGGAAAGGVGNVIVGTRIGGLDVAAWLGLARRERAIERETTQRLVVLSGSSARLSNLTTLVGPFGAAASAGPELWVEPEALEGGLVRLRIWSAVGDVRVGPYGTLHQGVQIEGATEIEVRSGTPVLIADQRSVMERADRGVLSRGGERSSTRGWIVVTARITDDPSGAFELPEGIPREWLDP
jgi:hypothetical protein